MIQAIKDELANDPLGIGYAGMVLDQDVVASLNNKIYSNSNSISLIYEYMFNKNHRTNQGTDTQYVPMIGRLSMVANAAVGSDPFGRGAGGEVNLIQKTACITLLELLNSPNAPTIDFTDSNFPLGSVNGAGVISPAHKDAIIALSENQISRAQQLGLPKIREGHIQEARA